jgi:GMP synthase-like glutamine amidotransferase
LNKTIAFIDNFIETPANDCVNEFITRTGLACTYHQPVKYGFNSLNKLSKADAFIVLGSFSNVTSPEPWHSELLDYLLPKIESGIPALGICFGHQLFAHHFGCEIDFINSQQEYIQKIRTLSLVKDVWGLKLGDKFQLSYSHKQVIKTLSDQFEVLGTAQGFAYEFIKHKILPIYSLQSHPESIDETSDVRHFGNVLLDSFVENMVLKA